MKSLLFVCAGNICRSPCLQAVMQNLIEKKGLSKEFFIDSCGITSYYLGKQSDMRMRTAAEKKGLVIDHIARLFDSSDFSVFDAIFAVDRDVLSVLMDIASTADEKQKLHLVSEFSKNSYNQEMRDPYYNGEEGFQETLLMSQDCCEGILEWILSAKMS